MNEHIRRRALMATAKVALSFTVMGCGTVMVDDTAPAAPEEDELPILQPAPEYDVSLQQPVVAPQQLSCEAPPLGQEITLNDEVVSCCSDELGPLLPGLQDDWEAFMAEYGQDEDAKACCGVLIASSDAAFNNGEEPDGLGWEALQACCMLVEHPVGPTCTPWGPPVPPALWRRLDSLDALQAQPLAEVA